MKKIYLLIIFVYSSLYLFSFSLNLIYNEKYYSNVKINSTEVITLQNTFYPLRNVDQSQVHRLLLTLIERSRLNTLQYVGEKLNFNGVSVQLLYNGSHKKYRITEENSGFDVLFGLDGYGSIYLFSIMNFGDKEISKFDYFATAFSVKLFLKQLTGKTYKKSIKITNEGLNYQERSKEYNILLDKLKNKTLQEVLYLLRKHVELNFDLDLDNNIVKSDWTNPVNLFFYKKGNYKSIAFFYYYTLKELRFNVRTYLVTDLIKKTDNDLEKIYTTKPNEKMKIEMAYKNISTTNVVNYSHGSPPDIFYYYPPRFNDSIFLVAVQDNKKWLFTTGSKWVDLELYSSEECCVEYMKSGCYYTYVLQDESILKKDGIDKYSLTWNIVYSEK